MTILDLENPRPVEHQLRDHGLVIRNRIARRTIQEAADAVTYLEEKGFLTDIEAAQARARIVARAAEEASEV